MTPKQADKIIASGQPVTVKSEEYGESFMVTFTERNRHSITSADGGIYDRSDLTVVPPPTTTLYQIQTEQLCDRSLLYWTGSNWTYRVDDAEAYSTLKSAQAVLTILYQRGLANPLSYVQPFTSLEVSR